MQIATLGDHLSFGLSILEMHCIHFAFYLSGQLLIHFFRLFEKLWSILAMSEQIGDIFGEHRRTIARPEINSFVQGIHPRTAGLRDRNRVSNKLHQLPQEIMMLLEPQESVVGSEVELHLSEAVNVLPRPVRLLSGLLGVGLQVQQVLQNFFGNLSSDEVVW